MGLLWCAWLPIPASAAFTSFYIFGDGVCTTTNNPSSPYYYGNRYCNGRVWIEVLAQRQGVTYDPNKNWSYFGHDSSNLVIHVNSFIPPPDAGTTLFVVWNCDADFVWNVEHYETNSTQWNTAITQSLTNHYRAITNLYAKGARTLLMPNAVDLSQVPNYSGMPAAQKAFIRQRTISYNASFTNVLALAKAVSPNLTIYVPDFFGLLDNMIAQPGIYGLIHPGLCALEDPGLHDYSLDGPGAYYLFWDYLDPSAKAHAVMADIAQQLVAPVRIGKITAVGASNRLDVANFPIGLDGFVDGSTNFTAWAAQAGLHWTNSPNATFFVSPSDPYLQFYRLRFPFAWSWP